MLKHNLLPPAFAAAGLVVRRWRHRAKLLRRYWLSPHRPFTPLFVLATYRSGSNLLIDYLGGFPGVRCYAEVLSPRLPIGPPRGELTPKRALRHLRYSLQSLKTPVRGCKLMLDQLAGCRLTPADLHEAFPTAKYIVLYRQSLAEQLVSIRTAQTTRQWVVHQGQAALPARVRIEPVELRWYCDEIRRLYAPLVASPLLAERGVLLSYEELAADPQRVFAERICPLLGLDYREPQTTLKRQNPQPLAERIENHAEVASLLSTPHCRQQYAWQADQAPARAA